MIEQAVLLVGGKGERLNDGFRYTPIDYQPKPLVEVGGKPFITYAINILRVFGVKDIVLLVGFQKERFEFLEEGPVRLITTQPDVDKAVLSIPDLQEYFILLNGDCLPILNWSNLLSLWGTPTVPIKMNLRDAGVAVVSKADLVGGKVSCGNIFKMKDIYPNMMIEGGLHVGTYQGLSRARQYMDTVVFGA